MKELNMRVLIADDSEPIRDRLIERLSRLNGVQTSVAKNASDALRQVKSFSPNVAVVDIRMPGGGGIKLLSAIKKNFPAVIVIVMTNYPYAQYRRKCMERGADFFFDKSTEFDQVAATIEQLMTADDVSEVAHRIAAAQLVSATEDLEKVTQRRLDMHILSLLHRPPAKEKGSDAYSMWEKTFDAMPDMVAILDVDHTIVRVNKAMAVLLDVPAAELTGQKCFDYIHGARCPIPGCPHEAMLTDLREHQMEAFIEKLQRWFLITVSPVLDGTRLIGAIHIAHDITERRRAAELVKASEVRYRQLFEFMQCGFALHEMIFDEQGLPCDYRFLEVNSAFESLIGISADQLIGQSVRQMFPSIEEKWIALCATVVSTREPVRMDDYSGHQDRHYSISVYSPSPGRFATIFTDITEQKNAVDAVMHARDAAEKASRVKTQFLANISHELRTPLNAVIGLSELLMDSPLTDEQLDYVQTINVSGEDLLIIIADLLDLSKIEMGKLEVKKEPFEFRPVVDKVMDLLSPFAEKKGLRFSCEIGASVGDSMIGDADRLRQVLINLLNNALKFTDRGFVLLRVEPLETSAGHWCLEFSVEDSGCGMTEETLGRIFKPFQQGDNSMTRKHGGSGLGLAITRNLVELMGGSIQVKSRVGQGSVFRFHLADSEPLVSVSDV